MREYLIGLIDRMNDTSDQIMEPGYNSSKTISYKALREAEAIKDIDFIPELIEYLNTEENKKNRDRAYFILGHLTKNTNDVKGLEALIKGISKEKDKYIVGSILDRISAIEKPEGINIEPIIAATKSDKWLIRHSAIPALKKTSNPKAEDALIEVLKSSTDPLDLSYTNATLSEIGTTSSIPHLKGLLTHKKNDVASSSLHAIIKIGGKDYINLYRAYLSNGKLKSCAISGVVAYGDESDVPLIEKRIKELVSKKRKIQMILAENKTEVVLGLEFLKKIDSKQDKFQRFIDWLLNKKVEKLWDSEIEWIENEKLHQANTM